MLICKKQSQVLLKDGFYSTDIHSFTKNKTSTVIVSEEFLGSEDKVLIIDDFLANGDASLGLYDIAQQASRNSRHRNCRKVSKMDDKDWKRLV